MPKLKNLIYMKLYVLGNDYTYRFDGNVFMVHLNFGWGGKNNGWYNLFDSIATDGNTELRLFITVTPVNDNTQTV